MITVLMNYDFLSHNIFALKIVWLYILYLDEHKFIECYFLLFRWQKISDPNSIEEVLKQVYADHSTRVDKVFSRIIETTQHPAAAASFASIMFAPKGQLTFQEALNRYRKISCSLSVAFNHRHSTCMLCGSNLQSRIYSVFDCVCNNWL